MKRRSAPLAGMIILLAGLTFGDVCDLILVDSVTAPGTLTQPVIVGQTTFVAGAEAGIVRIDTGSPNDLLVLGSDETQDSAYDIAHAYFENLLVVADGAAGISTYSLQGDASPQHVATSDLGTTVISLGGGGSGFTAGGENGVLYTVVLDGNGEPGVQGQLAIAGQVVDVLELPGIAYCALGSAQGLAVVDVSDRSSPTVSALVNLSGPVVSVGSYRDLVLAGVDGVGVVVFDTSQGGLQQVSTIELAAAPTSIISWNERLYMAGPGLGVVVADPTLGTEILVLSTLDLPGARGQTLLGDFVFVGRGSDGFSTVNTSDCANDGGDLTTSFIPAAARAPGSSGSFWLTDMAIANFSPGVATANVAYLPKGESSLQPLSTSMALGSGEQLFLGDVFDGLLGLESANGGLRVIASHSDVKITSRTYNAAGEEGTYGQFIPAQRSEDAVTSGNSGAIIQLQDNVDFRTNIGMVNLGEGDVDVEIDLYHTSGSFYGTVSRRLRAYEMKQVDRIFEDVTGDPVDSGYAVVKVLTDGGRIQAYASVVDNGSNDPIYIPAQVLSDGSPFFQ